MAYHSPLLIQYFSGGIISLNATIVTMCNIAGSTTNQRHSRIIVGEPCLGDRYNGLSSPSFGGRFIVAFLRPTAKSTAQPPASSLKSGNQINPCPHIAQNTITGRHCQKEETGNRRQLHQTPVPPVPAKAPYTGPAILPHHYTRNRHQRCRPYNTQYT